MKNRFLIIVFAALTLASCGQKKNTVTSEMTPEQAIEVLSAKIARHEKDHSLYYDRARMLMQVGRVNDAISDLQQAIQFKDDKVEYLLLLADAYFANGDVEKSYNTLNRVLELEPDNAEAVLKQGEVAFYSKDYDRALDHLSKVTEKDPNNRTALFLKSFVYKGKGDTSNAVVLLRKVCDLYPDYDAAFEELGVLYSTHHDPLAVEYLTTAIQLNPENANARYALAMFYQETNNMDAAEETYKQLLEVTPSYREAWHNLGYIEMFTYGDYEKAIEYLSRAIEADKTFAEAYVNRGIAYELQGDKKAATADFSTAHDLRPAYQPAIDGLERMGRR